MSLQWIIMVISNDKWRDLQSERTQKFSDSECCDARGLYTGTMSMVPSGQDFRDIYAILWISVCIIFSVQLQRSEGLPIGYVFFLDLRVLSKFSVNSILQKEPEKNPGPGDHKRVWLHRYLATKPPCFPAVLQPSTSSTCIS